MGEDKKTKVSFIIESLKESKNKYIEIITPTGKTAMKIKLNIDGEDMVGFLDEFYDAGFSVKSITKEDFDSYEADEKINFNI